MLGANQGSLEEQLFLLTAEHVSSPMLFSYVNSGVSVSFNLLFMVCVFVYVYRRVQVSCMWRPSVPPGPSHLALFCFVLRLGLSVGSGACKLGSTD